MSDIPACACQAVSYDPIDYGDGTFSDNWTCNDCGAQFAKIFHDGPREKAERERDDLAAQLAVAVEALEDTGALHFRSDLTENECHEQVGVIARRVHGSGETSSLPDRAKAYRDVVEEVTKHKDTVDLYERVHAELDDRKPWDEIDQGLTETMSYEQWLSYMTQRMINAARSTRLALAKLEETP